MLESGMVSSSRYLLLQRYARLDLEAAQIRRLFDGKLCKILTLPYTDVAKDTDRRDSVRNFERVHAGPVSAPFQLRRTAHEL